MKWFEIGLVVLTLATGIIWLLDRLLLARRRDLHCRRLLEPAVTALGTTHRTAVDTHGTIGHHITGGASGAADDHPDIQRKALSPPRNKGRRA